jgi:hypothetical protein
MGERMSGLVQSLVNREVTVLSHGLKVSGKLLAVRESQTLPHHRPQVLVLRSSLGLCLVRDWTLIAFTRGS